MPDKEGLEKREPTSLQGIAMQASACKDHRFQNLYGMLNEALLLDCWSDLNKKSASGVDGVSAEVYEENLYANIHDLVERLKTKHYRAQIGSTLLYVQTGRQKAPIRNTGPGGQAGAIGLYSNTQCDL